jgi:hypothetical protein
MGDGVLQAPQNPNSDRASKHPYDSFFVNWDIGHLVVMIIFQVTKALSISYDIFSQPYSMMKAG